MVEFAFWVGGDLKEGGKKLTDQLPTLDSIGDQLRKAQGLLLRWVVRGRRGG